MVMMRRSTSNEPRVGDQDLVPLGERLALLQAFRLFLALAVVVVPRLSGDNAAELVPITGAYLLLLGAGEIVRRRTPRWNGWLLSGAVLIDGAYLTLSAWRTGGYGSPVLVLVLMDVMVVTLLVSYRTGLKLATWCALILGLLTAASTVDGLGSGSGTSATEAVLVTVGLLLFAAVAAFFSSVNERALRSSRAFLEAQVRLDAELEVPANAMDVLLTVASHVRGRLGFSRAAALSRRHGVWSGVAVDDDSITPLEILAFAREPDDAWVVGEPRLISKPRQDSLVAEVLPGARNVAVVPVLVQSDELAIVIAEWGTTGRRRIPARLVRSISQSASHAAAVLRNARLVEELESLARRDPLTGLANRRVFEDALQREANRAQRTGSSLSLILFDVDGFKQINDTRGHQAGDAVLQDLGSCLVANTKGFDFTARYGGDEFIILLPDCSRDNAVAVCERLEKAMELRPDDVRATVSAGVATIPDDALDAAGLIGAADRALYVTKRYNRERSAR
jgi:two-component system, cell cycle response regulator